MLYILNVINLVNEIDLVLKQKQISYNFTAPWPSGQWHIQGCLEGLGLRACMGRAVWGGGRGHPMKKWDPGPFPRKYVKYRC